MDSLAKLTVTGVDDGGLKRFKQLAIVRYSVLENVGKELIKIV